VWITIDHFDDRDMDRALLVAQTTRFGPGTRGRIAAYLADQDPNARLDWSAEPPALFESTVPVALETTGNRAQTYRFRVHMNDRTVEPMDDPSRSLINQIATWAASPTSHGERSAPKP